MMRAQDSSKLFVMLLLASLLPLAMAPNTKASLSPYLSYSVVWCRWLGGNQTAAMCTGNPFNLHVNDTILIETSFRNISPYNLTVHIVAQIRNSTNATLANADFRFNVWWNTTSLNAYYYKFTRTQLYIWNATFTVTQYNATTSPKMTLQSDIPPQVYHEERRWNVTPQALSIEPFLPFIALIPMLMVKRLRRR